MKTTIAKIIRLTLPAIVMTAVAAKALAIDNTTRRKLKVDPAKAHLVDTRPSADTLTSPLLLDSISLSGFDKPLRSKRETLFVSNGTATDISGIVVDCDYSDLAGRQLHRRQVTVRCDIPAGQTRQISFRSWDCQEAFHYRLSAKPRRADGTPFDVRCTVVAVIIPHTTDR